MDFSKSIYSEEYKHLVDLLKKAREDTGLTQNEVGARLGVSQSFISKIESGQYRIDIVQLLRFARLYQKKLSFFVKES